MARTLDVYLEKHLVGQLVQDNGDQMLFRYAPAWLGSAESFPISRSLPLRGCALPVQGGLTFAPDTHD